MEIFGKPLKTRVTRNRVTRIRVTRGLAVGGFQAWHIQAREHKSGQNATLELTFLSLIGIFRTPKWKENHPERLKKSS